MVDGLYNQCLLLHHCNEQHSRIDKREKPSMVIKITAVICRVYPNALCNYMINIIHEGQKNNLTCEHKFYTRISAALLDCPLCQGSCFHP